MARTGRCQLQGSRCNGEPHLVPKHHPRRSGRRPNYVGWEVLAGAAGVGKTRLAREARGRRQGNTRWVYGTASARSTRLGAFEGLLVDLSSDPARIVSYAKPSRRPRTMRPTWYSPGPRVQSRMMARV